MIMTPSSFTYEHLSSLKFKELQKLSVQLHVNKRWAKKQELIANLLALKEKQEDEQEWRDATTVFSDIKDRNENEDNKRLTYNVIKRLHSEHCDPHLTFEVPQNGTNLLSETINSRETYDIPPSKTDFDVELLKDSRATFEIPTKMKLSNGTDSRATYDVCKNGEKLLEENTINEKKYFDEVSSGKKNVKISEMNMKGSKFKAGEGEIKKVDSKLRMRKQENKEMKKQEVKILTVPYVRATRRTRIGEACKNDFSPLKMSKKSINIKKSMRLPASKTNAIKSPAFSSVKKPVSKQTIAQSLTKNHCGEIVGSKVPIRLKFKEEKSNLANEGNKENIKNISRKISKTVDELFDGNPDLAKVNFRTSPPSMTNGSKFVALKKTHLKKDAKEKLNSNAVQTPGNKVTAKPITATKMPDFSKIHKRQFEQMDSLHDYLKKKEDRIRKLFGTPQPGQQLHNLNKSAPVFHFQSTTSKEKENKESKDNMKSVPFTPLKKRANNLKYTQKEAIKGKLRFGTDIKDKSRSQVYGVRTNKRFELQMKFRNM